MATKAPFITLPSGDALLISLIGSCTHYPDHGVMMLNTKGEKLFWHSEEDNVKARAIRDDIVAKLTA
ncbi:TPA: hypothetical protein ACSP21_000249 [Aeromonas veronii]